MQSPGVLADDTVDLMFFSHIVCRFVQLTYVYSVLYTFWLGLMTYVKLA